jgi:hypothetical protein
VQITTAGQGDTTMIERMRRHRRLGSAAIVVRLLVFGVGAAHGEELADCYRATIPAPMVLPDGSLHPAGELRICTTRRLSPVEWLHVTYVGGGAVGAFRGRDTVIERGVEPREPEFVFLRGFDGSLRLFGFTTSTPRGARLHKLIPVASPLTAMATRGACGGIDRCGSETVTMIASVE